MTKKRWHWLEEVSKHICLQRHSQEMDSSEAFPLKLNLNVISHNEPFEVSRIQNSIQ